MAQTLEETESLIVKQLQRSIDRNGRLVIAVRNVANHLEDLERKGIPVELDQLRVEVARLRAELIKAE